MNKKQFLLIEIKLTEYNIYIDYKYYMKNLFQFPNQHSKFKLKC